MKVGDLIRRRDMSEFHYRILGESDQWKDMWHVELVMFPLSFKPHLLIEQGMIAKDDARWEIVK